ILNVMEGYAPPPFGSAPLMHLQTEALRRAYVDRNAFLGDPDFVSMPLGRLLAKWYARTLRAGIDPEHATPTAPVAVMRSEETDALGHDAVDRPRYGRPVVPRAGKPRGLTHSDRRVSGTERHGRPGDAARECRSGAPVASPGVAGHPVPRARRVRAAVDRLACGDGAQRECVELQDRSERGSAHRRGLGRRRRSQARRWRGGVLSYDWRKAAPTA